MQWAFMLVVTLQAIIVLTMESYVFAKFQLSLEPGRENDGLVKTIPTYLTLFIFGFLYQLVLVYDALRLKNTIQVIGLCIYNLGMLVYAAIQYDQVREAIEKLKARGSIDAGVDLWPDLKPFLLAAPFIITFFTVLMALAAWKLWDEFAWTIYKSITADLRQKRRYLTYQIYIALLKFDFFFFLGFTVQFLVIVNGVADAEFYLTIAAVPISIVILLLAAYFTRKEVGWGMLLSIVLYICGLAYFAFKLARMYTKSTEEAYLPARKNLTSFAVITILLITITIVNASLCWYNFNKGLKAYTAPEKVETNWKDPDAEMLPTEYMQQKSARMTID